MVIGPVMDTVMDTYLWQKTVGPTGVCFLIHHSVTEILPRIGGFSLQNVYIGIEFAEVAKAL